MNPPGFQELYVRADGKEVIRRWSFCDKHQQRSSSFQGPDQHGWLWRCQANGFHTSHLFYSDPDPSAPKTAADLPKWMEKQRANRLKEARA